MLIEINFKKLDLNDIRKIEIRLMREIYLEIQELAEKFHRYSLKYKNKKDVDIKRYVCIKDDIPHFLDVSKEYCESFEWIDEKTIVIETKGVEDNSLVEVNIYIVDDKDNIIKIDDLSLKQLLSLKMLINNYMRPWYADYKTWKNTIHNSFAKKNYRNWLVKIKEDDISEEDIIEVWNMLNNVDWVYDGHNLYLQKPLFIWYSGTSLIEIHSWIDDHYLKGVDSLINNY